MEYKLFLSTFWMIFLAELGDKTQIAILAQAMESKSLITVFLGSSLALILSSVIAIFTGSLLAKWIPMNYVGKIAGIVFIVLGVFFLLKK